jgi:hypothetical protein
MKAYRIIYSDYNSHGILETIFSAKVLCKSMRGAERKAKNLEPFTWSARSIISLEDARNLALDKIEFNY